MFALNAGQQIRLIWLYFTEHDIKYEIDARGSEETKYKWMTNILNRPFDEQEVRLQLTCLVVPLIIYPLFVFFTFGIEHIIMQGELVQSCFCYIPDPSRKRSITIHQASNKRYSGIHPPCLRHISTIMLYISCNKHRCTNESLF